MDDAVLANLAASVMDDMADLVVAVGPDTTLLYANRAASERFGWPRGSLIGTTVSHLVHPDDLGTALHSLASVLEKESGTLIDLRMHDSSGEYSRFEIRGRAWRTGPVPGAVIMNMREITDRRAWELGAGDATMLNVILEHLPTVTVIVDSDGLVRSANRALTRTLHRALEETRGYPFLDLVADFDRDTVRQNLTELTGTSGTRQMEINLLTSGGVAQPMHVIAVDLTSDRAVRGLVLVAHDISALVRARQELHRLAGQDDLTGLPNRARLHAYLSGIIENAGGCGYTILFGDVDGLKAVNDRFGHHAGDALLVAMADRLRQVVRAEDLVARLSGDEFVLVLATDDAAVIANIKARIDRLMAEPILLPNGKHTTVGISLGMAPVGPGISAEELLATADAAMYAAKRARVGQAGSVSA